MTTSSTCITRFAPSPTGFLHLGHAYSALLCQQAAEKQHGRFLLRIEDIDFTRCRKEYEDAIYEDLAWLGLRWEDPVRRQSEHLAEYQNALELLRSRGLLYPCFCTRKDIQRELGNANPTPATPDEALYPGICRNLSADESQARIAKGETFSLRLNLERALHSIGDQDLSWHDQKLGQQQNRAHLLGDVILARKDIHTSYHLSVVLDDALQQINLITRGEDLFTATHIHRLLQALLDLPTPNYHHHALIKDEQGTRMAKRKKSLSLRDLRHAGHSPQYIIDRFAIDD
ncbi:MAG: tRNA glutamyl-Q(34) synthetase GluQRS [Verrucomicrobiales bacterium]|nr:tRNA glutamyl-Q(34) synthetase GluQRS [Verrucomicrobiales bacterium]